ncbi:MAG: VWA domain-containing protein [Deltaproteobacteria bacterium]|jgi:serine/threonine-protein kinase PpkA|nr:VWA domain-containing protein [Deltaproteobacteria bacterium]
MKTFFASLLFGALALTFWALAFPAGPLLAQAQRTPLLMEGKKTLYQRVIIRPNPVARKRIGGDPTLVEDLLPFSVWYVYDKVEDSGLYHYRIGAGTKGEDLWWVRGDKVAEWNSSTVLLFAEKSGRESILFFKEDELDALKRIGGGSNVGGNLRDLESRFINYQKNNETPLSDFPVVAMEPTDEQGAVPSDKFYILPVFEYQEDPNFEGVKFLNVGSIDPGISDQVGSEPKESEQKQELGVAFVIDTTISMKPYIDATLDFTQQVFDGLVEKDGFEGVSLAVVAFRNSLRATPGLGYESRVFADFMGVEKRNVFAQALKFVEEATLSTHSFNEHSFNGMMTAVEKLKWPEDGGVIVLITDAGPLELTDPYRCDDPDSGCDNYKFLESLAEEKNIKFLVVHLKTPAGRANHAYAKGEFDNIAFKAGCRKGYMPLEIPVSSDGSAAFAGILDDFYATAEEAAYFDKSEAVGNIDCSRDDSDVQTLARDLGTLIGHSVRLNYLARVNKTTAPIVVSSWITDLSLPFLDSPNPRKVPNVNVAVLLTRAQLSVLRDTVQYLLDEAQKDVFGESQGTRNFFDGLLTTASSFIRDPEVFELNPESTLSEVLVANEFLDGLPYKSEIMTLSRDRWEKMAPTSKEIYIISLRDKLRAYELYDTQTEAWGNFGDDPLDYVFRVPLAQLP